ncbi:MAG TPA: alpha/beta hydrolase [Streptosporangiaceae bacterium]|nr:alpha/beta hydrolase [Streptosporangiaceae bacterium]
MSSIRPFEERLLPGSAGATIATAFWPGAGEPLVCVHGLTSSSRAFAGLATELPGRALLAVDCLGRGNSSKQGPFGLARHADDLAAVMAAAGIDRATIVGHSMGAYIAGAFCAAYPDRVSSLVFIDGGYAPEIPAAADPEQLLAVVLGPFLEKLRRVWPSADEYIAYYESLPLYPDGVDVYGRVHLGYDLTGEPPRLRARMTADCLAPDWRDILDAAAASRRLAAITVPLLLLRAPGGLTGTGDMVVPDPVRDAITARVAGTSVVDVPGTNHHTILLSRPGAAAVAEAIQAFTGSRLSAA